MPNARPRIAAAVIAAATALAACSSGGGSDASPTTRQKRATTTTTAAATTTTGGAATTGAQWFTYDHDSARTGVAPDGPASAAAVRRLWASAALDGDVYAQPLVVGDRVIVATANDTVYALNASDGTVAWSTHLGTPVAARSLPCGDVDPVGITGTPVVDLAAGRVYAVGMVQPTRDMLFDLDLASGRLIASTVVDAPGADPTVHNQRAALTLEGNTVYVPYGGRYGDCGNYHGRVVAVPVTSTGLGTAISFLLPTQREGGFWSPPGASVAADGSLFLASGNSSSSGAFDYGNSVVRLTPDLRLADSFAPTNWEALNRTDADLGSTSPVLLPGQPGVPGGQGRRRLPARRDAPRRHRRPAAPGHGVRRPRVRRHRGRWRHDVRAVPPRGHPSEGRGEQLQCGMGRRRSTRPARPSSPAAQCGRSRPAAVTSWASTRPPGAW